MELWKCYGKKLLFVFIWHTKQPNNKYSLNNLTCLIGFIIYKMLIYKTYLDDCGFKF